jgi:hypothetical protein
LCDHDGGSGLDGVPDTKQIDLDLVAESLFIVNFPEVPR